MSSGSLAGLTNLGAPAAAVPAPRGRWRTRYLLPLAVLLGVGALAGYAGRRALWPTIPVRLAPVIVKDSGGPASSPSGNPGAPAAPVMTVQAPGWVEPNPYPISVPALTEGVIRELLVLEGQRIEAGAVVARMIDDEARLAVQRSKAALAARTAEAERAAAAIAVERARVDELTDDIARKKPLVESRAIGAAEVRQLELRLTAQQAMVKTAEAGALQARAAAEEASAMLAEAELRLQRMEIRSPTGGVVLARLAEPGSRMMLVSDSPTAALVARLYDPANMQVRVDIPLADAAKVGVGHTAEITCEALPGVTLKGHVARLVHEANIQKNTVQVKVAIASPPPDLKPEMLARVRFFAPPASTGHGHAPTDPAGGPGALFVPEAAVVKSPDGVESVFVFDAASSTVRRATPKLGPAADGYRPAAEGLRPGDRVVVSPPANLREGSRVQPSEATP